VHPGRRAGCGLRQDATADGEPVRKGRRAERDPVDKAPDVDGSLAVAISAKVGGYAELASV